LIPEHLCVSLVIDVFVAEVKRSLIGSILRLLDIVEAVLLVSDELDDEGLEDLKVLG